MKRLVKSLLARTPYKLMRRTRLNRFQALEETITSLASRGFNPRAVIDGGANVGEFTRTAVALFKDAIVHAIEPQPGCQAPLQRLSSASNGRVFVHTLALCAPESDKTTLRLATDVKSMSTGAHVAPGEDGLEVPCRTLDAALAQHAATTSDALLKLDLQGYELMALRGATETLKNTSVVLIEVSFYAQAYEPPISALVGFLATHGFELYDIASIYARPRDDRPRQGDFVFVRTSASLAADKAWS